MKSPTQYASVLTAMRDRVFATRRLVERAWPTPDLYSSMMYALTEAGEALDAYLRLQRVDDARNHDKDMSVEHELAQCLMMVLTACGPIGKFEPTECAVGVKSIAEWMSPSMSDRVEPHALCGVSLFISQIINAMWSPTNGIDDVSLAHTCAGGVLALCDWIGIDVDVYLSEELERVQSKWTL